MKWYSAFIIGLLVEWAASNSSCFTNTLGNCHSKFMPQQTSDSTFCMVIKPMTECIYEAVTACNADFEQSAEKSLSIQNDLCTDGTNYNKAVKADKNCGIDSLMEICKDEPNNVTKERKQKPNSRKVDNNDACAHIDDNRDCMYQKFEKCSKDAHYILQATYDSFTELYKKVCEIMS